MKTLGPVTKLLFLISCFSGSIYSAEIALSYFSENPFISQIDLPQDSLEINQSITLPSKNPGLMRFFETTHSIRIQVPEINGLTPINPNFSYNDTPISSFNNTSQPIVCTTEPNAPLIEMVQVFKVIPDGPNPRTLNCLLNSSISPNITINRNRLSWPLNLIPLTLTTAAFAASLQRAHDIVQSENAIAHDEIRTNAGSFNKQLGINFCIQNDPRTKESGVNNINISLLWNPWDSQLNQPDQDSVRLDSNPTTALVNGSVYFHAQVSFEKDEDNKYTYIITPVIDRYKITGQRDKLTNLILNYYKPAWKNPVKNSK